MKLGEGERIVYCDDVFRILSSELLPEGASYVCSLPDFSEFSKLSLEEWKLWFKSTAKAVLQKLQPGSVAIFFQSDIKQNNDWIDKGYLIQCAADELKSKTLWQKIVVRGAPGSIHFGRPGYSRLLCFGSSHCSIKFKFAVPDVLLNNGESTWIRGMPIEVAKIVARFIREHSSSQVLVNPFCGEGSVLAAGILEGLSVIGIERSVKRAEKALTLKIAQDGMTWDKGA